MEHTTSSLIFGLIAAMFFGMSKTGVPGISLPGVLMMTLAFPAHEKLSTGAVLPLLVVADLFAVRYYWRSADYKRIVQLLPTIVVGLFVGTAVLRSIDHHQFKICLGVLVLVMIAFEELRRRMQWNAFPKSRWFAWTMGFLTGFTTLIGNAAGPVNSVYLAAQNFDKTRFMGTTSVLFCIVNLSKLPLIGGAVPGLNMITADSLWFDLMLLPGLLLGVFIGRQVYQLIPEKYFVPLVLLLNLIVPLQMLLF
ncbi:MAG: sulfite exporter TauE/SafE family protein [Planctomycetaceae bacterium]|nr:sulfite exporter TauE/SafE family protein [Planctomycetaceae bacterium]